jgi:hypothetical protein
VEGTWPNACLAILAVLAALSFGTPALMADHRDKSQKHQQGNKHFDDGDDHGWERRDGYEFRIYGDRDERPPGWSRGKKTGWGDCGLPPGQAKKYGCRSYTHQGRPHYYYKDELGRIIIRHPTIEAHGGVVVH